MAKNRVKYLHKFFAQFLVLQHYVILTNKRHTTEVKFRSIIILSSKANTYVNI
jgi:hypothetical protein